jgi:hypothetical protein
VTGSPEDGAVTLTGTIDVDDQVEGQVSMIGLLDADDLAAGNTSFQQGAYIYVYRKTADSWRIGVTDGNAGGEIVQAFVEIPVADLPGDGVLDVVFTVDGTADGTACAAGAMTSPAGCLTLQLSGGSVSTTISDSYGDIVGTSSASPEFSNGAVPGWDDYVAANVGYELTVTPVADLQPPVVLDVTANPVAMDGTGLVTATIDDVGAGGSNIASASLTFDGGTPIAMTASDGAFDSALEDVEGSFAAPSEPGLYEVCVQGTDGAGNTSVPECASVAVYDPSGGFVTGGGWIDSPPGAMSSLLPVWDQGFEIDDSGWTDDATEPGYGLLSRVASGTGGIASSDGGWHATAEGVAGDCPQYVIDRGIPTCYYGPFSRFDGYRDTWAGTWTAELDVYLDPAWSVGEGFDYSVAATGSDGNHQRDYIFHVGVHSDGRLLVNGSNNTDFYVNDYKLVNDGDGTPYEVTTAGWYTLQHVFYETSGALAVDLNLLDPGGNVVFTTTRFNAADAIPAEVGGNRYAWFTHVTVEGGIAIDEHQLFYPVSPTGKATFGFNAKYKKGASEPDGNTQFQFKAGDLNFHSASYDWLLVNQAGENAQFKGDGTINGTGDYKFMLWAGDHDSGDTFRIKIWEETSGGENVVYDNGTDQVIGGGSIIVHDGKKKK